MRLKIIRSFAQLNVAILLLLIIAGFSILGTIIEQDQTIQYYQQNYSEIFSPLDISFGNILLFFGLDHVYKTWWFLSLLFLFGTCLISCTFTQQLPALHYLERLLDIFQVTLSDSASFEYFYIFLGGSAPPRPPQKVGLRPTQNI